MRNLISPLDGIRSPFMRRGFSPRSLFSAGEIGAWYDPSDLSTLFQDAAGTTPVTAVEQPVGRILDKSGRGNHATQSTSASRPVLSARVNLLTRTEQFDNAVWTKTRINPFGSGSVANTTATLDPLGGNTSDFIQEDANSTTHVVLVSQTVSSISYTASIYAKAAGRNWIALAGPWPNSGAWFDLANGVVGTKQAGVASHSITSVGNGWYLCSLTGTAAAGTANFQIYIANADNSVSYTGNGTSGIYIWGADLRVSNAGVNLPVYQRVVTATDYDTTGFPMYLRFDGTDDSMATGTINPGAVDKAQVFAGVRKLSDANAGAIVEQGTPGTSTDNFWINASAGTGGGFPSTANYEFELRGDVTYAGYGATTFTAPITNVISVAYDIGASGAANEVKPRVNASIPTLTPYAGRVDAGTGNFGNHPLYIGSRGGSSFRLNGQLYSLIVRFSATNLPDATIAQTETWVNGKTYAYGPVTPNPLIWGSGNNLIWDTGNNITWGNS